MGPVCKYIFTFFFFSFPPILDLFFSISHSFYLIQPQNTHIHKKKTQDKIHEPLFLSVYYFGVFFPFLLICRYSGGRGVEAVRGCLRAPCGGRVRRRDGCVGEAIRGRLLSQCNGEICWQRRPCFFWSRGRLSHASCRLTYTLLVPTRRLCNAWHILLRPICLMILVRWNVPVYGSNE